MSTDPKKRAPTHRDFSRPPTAAPDVEVDPELTPPPFDTREAVVELWELRHVGEEVRKVNLKVDSYTQSFARLEAMFNELAWPMLKEAVGRIDDLLGRQEKNNAKLEVFFADQWPKLTRAVDELGERLERVEKKQDAFKAALDAHNDRIAKAERALADLERRLGIIELDKRDQQIATTAVKAERRRWWSYVVNARNAAIAAASTVTLVIARWGDVVDFFSSLGR